MTDTTTDTPQRSDVTLDTIVSLCKRRGFIFPGSEIYGGLQGTFDYGPLGAELKKNVKQAWWRAMIYERDDIEGLDASILMHPMVWKASGHVDGFSDPLCDCLGACRKRFRADHVEEADIQDFRITDITEEPGKDLGVVFSATSKKAAKAFLEGQWRRHLGLPQTRLRVDEVEGSQRRGKACPECGAALSEARNFNLMFKTQVGPVEETAATVYLRPETAQGIFVNFLNVQTAARRKIPFGIAQMGKSFRNEITPRNFIFRVREFEQMEVEFFCKPGHLCAPGEMTDEDWHNHWLEQRFNWYLRYGISKDHLRLRPHEKTELAHYARACSDVEFLFPIGWQELEGIANRTDFDLKQHAAHSKKDLVYFDPELKQSYVPYVIEPSAGADRSTLAFLVDAYREEQVNDEKRVVLRLHRELAPIKAAVFPLLKNRPELVEMAQKLTRELKKHMYATYDDTAAIGKLYRRQDEIGTPFCVTVDVDSLTDNAVTVRDRDSMQQSRIATDKLVGFIKEELSRPLA